MSNKHFYNQQRKPQMVKRAPVPVYRRENVLTTDYLPIVGVDNLTQHFPTVFANHSDPWYLHYEFYHDDAVEAVRRVPSILNSFNRSRTLRRARISGIRLCNLDTSRKPFRCINDMVISSTYGAMLIASLADTFCSIHQEVIINFTASGKRDKRLKEYRHNALLDKFWRRSNLSRHSVMIERLEDDDPLSLGFLSWRVTTTKSLFDVVYKLIEILYSEIDEVIFGALRSLRLSKSPTFDPEDYLYRPMDKVLVNVRYRRYSAFGVYHNNPQFLLY